MRVLTICKSYLVTFVNTTIVVLLQCYIWRDGQLNKKSTNCDQKKCRHKLICPCCERGRGLDGVANKTLCDSIILAKLILRLFSFNHLWALYRLKRASMTRTYWLFICVGCSYVLVPAYFLKVPIRNWKRVQEHVKLHNLLGRGNIESESEKWKITRFFFNSKFIINDKLIALFS